MKTTKIIIHHNEGQIKFQLFFFTFLINLYFWSLCFLWKIMVILQCFNLIITFVENEFLLGIQFLVLNLQNHK